MCRAVSPCAYSLSSCPLNRSSSHTFVRAGPPRTPPPSSQSLLNSTCVEVVGSEISALITSHLSSRLSAVVARVGIRWRDLQPFEAISSSGDVKWLIDGVRPLFARFSPVSQLTSDNPSYRSQFACLAKSLRRRGFRRSRPKSRSNVLLSAVGRELHRSGTTADKKVAFRACL